MRMQVILDSLFARLGSALIGGWKKGEFRDWTTKALVTATFATKASGNYVPVVHTANLCQQYFIEVVVNIIVHRS